MPYYIALIHKDADSCYGVSFPDLPGVVSAGDTIDEAMRHAAEALEFAAEDWESSGRKGLPSPRTIDDLRNDAGFQEYAPPCSSEPRPKRRSKPAGERVFHQKFANGNVTAVDANKLTASTKRGKSA